MSSQCPVCHVSKLSDNEDVLAEFQARHSVEHADGHVHTLLWVAPYTARCTHPHCLWTDSQVPPVGRIDWSKEERKVAIGTIRKSFREHHR